MGHTALPKIIFKNYQRSVELKNKINDVWVISRKINEKYVGGFEASG